jgi:hypothetical protein
MSTTGIPDQPVLVLSELMGETQVTRGIFSSMAEIEAYVYRFRNYEPEDGERIVARPLTVDTTDPDEYATSELVIVHPLRREETVTELFIWDSAKKREAYDPWRLFWCMVGDDSGDTFVVAHTLAEAAAYHTDNLGYDSCAELVMLLPSALQQRELTIGKADRELLRACGARFLEDDVVELGGETFDPSGVT